jgi:hypothetical protein
VRFAEGSEAISTVIGREVDVQVVLRDLMSILLTLLAGKVCWAKPNHAFFHCQQPRRKIFTPELARAPPRTPSPTSRTPPQPPFGEHPHRHHGHNAEKKST